MGVGGAVAAGLAAWACIQALRFHAGACVRLKRALDHLACVGHASWLAVSVETDALNHWPANVVNSWWRSSGGPLRTCSELLGKYGCGFYEMGVLVGIVTMLVGCTVVTVTALQVGSRLSSLASPGLPRMRKRADVRHTSKAQPWLAPVIPGLTVPLQEILPLLCTGFAGQLVHEAGHALAAAVHRIDPHSMGVGLIFPGIPMAFVSIPGLGKSAALRSLRRVQLRIVAAGVWYNALVAGALWLMGSLTLTHLFWTPAPGLAIMRSEDQGMAPYLPAGSHVLRINGLDLEQIPHPKRAAAWMQYTSTETLPDLQQCVASEAFVNATDSCCSGTSANSTACFRRVESSATGRCLDPNTLLGTPSLVPCSSSQACPSGDVCVRADRKEHLVRMEVQRETGSGLLETSVVVLRGLPADIARSLAISAREIRPWIQSVLGPLLTSLLWRIAETASVWLYYALLVNVALCLLNMLPLPALDGSNMIRLLLLEALSRKAGDQEAVALDSPTESWGESDSEMDVEDPLSPAESNVLRRAAQYQKHVERFMCIITGMALGGSLLVTWLHV